MADIVIGENKFGRKILAPYDIHPVIRYEVKMPNGELKCTDAVPFTWEELRGLIRIIVEQFPPELLTPTKEG